MVSKINKFQRIWLKIIILQEHALLLKIPPEERGHTISVGIKKNSEFPASQDLVRCWSWQVTLADNFELTLLFFRHLGTTKDRIFSYTTRVLSAAFLFLCSIQGNLFLRLLLWPTCPSFREIKWFISRNFPNAVCILSRRFSRVFRLSFLAHFLVFLFTSIFPLLSSHFQLF